MNQSIANMEAPAAGSEVVGDFFLGFISEEEYARRRGVTVRTCQRDRQLRKAPPYVHLGRRVFYRIEAVRQWLVSNERLDQVTATASQAGRCRMPRRWRGRLS